MSGLYALKPWYSRRLGRIVGLAVRRDVSPDVFTVVGVLAAALAAVAIWLGWWPLALLFLAARLGGANLDGAVARARGVSRPWGFVLNEIGDRSSDLLMYAGLVALAARTSGTWLAAPVVWTLLAAVAATMPTLASLAAAGAGATRRNGGPLGKDRALPPRGRRRRGARLAGLDQCARRRGVPPDRCSQVGRRAP